MFNPKKILVLAPHTDDGELGCGGMIAKFCGEGRSVHYVAFSTCAQSLPQGLPKDTLAIECRAATAELGIAAGNVLLLDYQVRDFPSVRQKLLDELRHINEEIKPDLALIPAASDIHQDHETIHREGLRAFKQSSILGYELPWNNRQFSPSFFVSLTGDQLNKKISALKKYSSQSHRDYMTPEFINALAKVRGVQCGKSLAEAFEVYRMLSNP